MQNFTTLIVDMVKKEKLFASQGGPIILAQVLSKFSTDNWFNLILIFFVSILINWLIILD